MFVMNKTCKSALWVGYGLMGRSLALSPSSDWLKKIGVVDTHGSALDQARVDLDLKPDQVFHKLGDGLRSGYPQVVVINTPSEAHYAQASAAIRVGAHVMVAKPAVSNLLQAERLLFLCKQYRRKLVVGQQIRFNRHYRAVAAFLASGELGTISHIHFLNSKPRPDPLNLSQMPHPALLEMSCHHFDALFAILPKAAPLAIFARGYKPSWSSYAANSMVDACIDLTDNVKILYHAGFDSMAPCYELRVEGSKGVLRVRGEHMSATSFSYEIASRSMVFSDIDLEKDVSPTSAWALFMENWKAWLGGGREPSFSLKNNLKVLALLQAGMEFAERTRSVNLSKSAKYRRILYL